MQALEIIRAEHRGMWRVSTALDGLARRGDGTGKQDARQRGHHCRCLLDYVDTYVDKRPSPERRRIPISRPAPTRSPQQPVTSTGCERSTATARSYRDRVRQTGA